MMLSALIEQIGKFHPLILHLPIGIFIYAYLHLAYDLFISNNRRDIVNIGFALGLGTITALFSSISGYLLFLNGEYSGGVMDWHMWLGFGVGLGSVMLVVLYQLIGSKKSFFGMYSVFIILLVATGHFGGSLTHGEGFLSLQDAVSESIQQIDDIRKANFFSVAVMPIVKRKCVSCHNPKKTKGELLLHTLEGWKKGGKSGKVVVPGNMEKSLLLNRIHLSISEKEHMPPSGKLQLEENEIQLLDWWVGAMANFEESVEELSPPKHILNFLDAKLDKSLKGVPEISDSDLNWLQQKGIPATRVRKDLPWISVSYARGDVITKQELKHMAAFKENIRNLAASKTSLKNQWLTVINEFSNLKTLDISLNSINSKGVAKLNKLSKLEYLNLYGTEVDATMLEHISQFPQLKTLFLWQSAIQKEDVLATDLPNNLHINLGQDLDVFDTVQLLPPTIEGDKDIFEDSILISITHVAPNAKIHYTLDGSIPDENSNLYSKPILLDKTVELSATANMEGWEESKVSQRSFLKSTSIPISCKTIPQPNDKYKGEGGQTLINQEKGSEQFGDGKWLGFSASDVSVNLDLGTEKEVSAVSFGCLQDYRSYIFLPIGTTISYSLNGISYVELKNEDYDQITGPADNYVKNVILDFPPINARYVKIEIIAQKKNPNWHSDPGADCWLFLDEVIIE
ncbi:MAG: c-type cytochrome domain-containing protein [Bacteroidota bacterium]